MPPPDPTIRVAGRLLVLGGVVALVAFAVAGLSVEPPRSGAQIEDHARAVVEAERAIELSGWIGLPADVLIICAAVLLTRRSLPSALGAPAAAGWVLVALAHALFIAVDIASATAFAPAAKAEGSEPLTFQIVHDLIERTFGFAVLVTSVGFGVVLLAEFRFRQNLAPPWLLLAGAGSAALTAVGAMSPLLAIHQVVYLLGFAGPLLAIVAYWGFRLSVAAESPRKPI